MPAKSVFRWLHVSSLWCYRAVTWTILTCAFLFALIVVAVRFWVLPNMPSYREPIARQLSDAMRQRVTIGSLEGHWSGVNLQLALGNVVIYDAANQPALTLERVDSTLSWWSLVFMEPRFDSIELSQPALNVKRDAKGVISVAGIEISQHTDGEGISEWLLRQEEISIRNASIVWEDELRGAPRLVLQNVDFRLENDLNEHRFGLRAEPPAALATPLDVRGSFAGRTLTAVKQWNGQLFTQLEYTDIAAWRIWVPFPVAFPHGAGAVRAWATLKNGELAQIVADVQLAQVTTRLGADLPDLDLAELKGRVAWKLLVDGFEVSTTRLSMSTHDSKLQPTDLRLVYHRAGKRPAHGEMTANSLDVAPLIALADHLPFDAGVRKELEAFAPRGSFYDVGMKWTGEWPGPDQYSVKARFANLGLNAVGRLPGLDGVTGSVDGSERGGTLLLNTQNSSVNLPQIFESKLDFETLSAQVGWQRNGELYEIRLNDVTFANRDVAGSVAGVYQTAVAGPGTIDLTAHATRADPRGIVRYLPLRAAERGRDWLANSFVGGVSNDAKLRLKGNLAEFPFAEGKGGTFLVTAHVTGGVLDYASGWPKIENIDGDLTFRGKRMDIAVKDASILGAKLSRVKAEIPDLLVAEKVVTVGGEADGPTSEFLSFIEKSPVSDAIDRFTDRFRAEGRSKLILKLVIPLAAPKTTKVAGDIQLFNNRLENEELFFPYEQVNGHIEFTESSVRVPGATMVLFGGPASMSGSTSRDGTVRFNYAGRANMDNFRRSSTVPILQALRGAGDWKASVLMRKRAVDFAFESSLQGVTSDLPAPLGKTAAESMPFKYERTVIGPQQERVVINVGSAVSANLVRHFGNDAIVERGLIALGGPAADPERKGLWITGGLKSFDLDQWLLLLKATGSDTGRSQLTGVDVKFGALDLFGRRFNELAINGTLQAGTWQTTLAGRELAGEMSWRTQGRGKVTARMKTLAVPASTPERPQLAAEKESTPDLPALDIKADTFMVRSLNLGKLELSAVPEGRDWKLEKLHVTNPDSTLTIDGVWQGWLTQPRTMVNVKLEVSDIGKFLVRMGQPEGIRRGTAKLEGPLSWTGAPTDLDYPTLAGNFVIEANKGQFVKLDPGIGKLLGVLSLQSLPRRLTLDFRDIFSEGLAFDEIVGTVKVNRGIANTENFRIQGPAVRIQMSGDVDLARETQKLHVKVYPSMSDSLSVAGALIGGPIAGIATFVAQKLLKDPIDKMAAHEYNVTGTWADPQVAKIEQKPATTATSPERTD